MRVVRDMLSDDGSMWHMAQYLLHRSHEQRMYWQSSLDLKHILPTRLKKLRARDKRIEELSAAKAAAPAAGDAAQLDTLQQQVGTVSKCRPTRTRVENGLNGLLCTGPW